MKSLNPLEWLRKAESSVLSAWQMVSFTVPETNPSIIPSQILQNADIRIPSEQMDGVPTEDELVFMRKAFTYILSWRGEKTSFDALFLPLVAVKEEMLPGRELGVGLARLDTNKPNTMIKLFTGTDRFQSEYFAPPVTCLDSWIHLYDNGAPEVYPTSGESARGQSSARSSHKASNRELVTAYNLLATALEVPNIPITLEDKRIALGGLGLLHDLT